MACGHHDIVDDWLRCGETPARSDLGSFFWRLGATLRLWRERARQRRALSQLDDRLLADIGVTRAEAEREAATPFWRPGAEGARERTSGRKAIAARHTAQ